MNNETKPDTTTWPQLAEGLYAFLTGRNATIEYRFENMEIGVPSSASNAATHAPWKLNGSLKIRTSES